MKEFLKVWFPILLLIVGAFWLTSKFIKPVPAKILTIATGRVDGSYDSYAHRYKKLLEKEDIEVHIINTAGSVETLKLLNEKKADIGFVQGGTLQPKDHENLEAVASIYYEPLWIFAKKSKKNLEYIRDLENLNISVGELGSGTQALVRQIAIANDLNISDSSKVKKLGLKDSYDAYESGDIDAFFTVVSLASPTVLELLKDPKTQAISLKRTKAYEQKFPYLSEIIIYEGSINLVENLPKKSIKLLATTASIAVRNDLDKVLVRLFTKVIKKENNRVDGFPNLKHLELPVNDQAKQYITQGDSILEKFFPYWIAVNIDRLKIMLIPLLTLMIPIFKGFMPLYRWRIRSKIYRWYKKIDFHEQRLEGYSLDDLSKAIKDLNNLKIEIKEQIDVPLPYMNEYYMLKMHVDFVLENIIKKKSKISN